MLHIQSGFPDPLANTPRLSLILKGMQRTQRNKHTRPARLPITGRLLRTMKNILRTSTVISVHDKLLLWAAYTTAFFGFLRVSEFVPASESSFDPSRTLLGEDVTLNSRYAFFRIKASKRYDTQGLYSGPSCHKQGTLPSPCTTEVPPGT